MADKGHVNFNYDFIDEWKPMGRKKGHLEIPISQARALIAGEAVIVDVNQMKLTIKGLRRVLDTMGRRDDTGLVAPLIQEIVQLTAMTEGK